MNRMRKYLWFLGLFAMTLSSCGFFPIASKSSTGESSADQITDFSLVQDEKLFWVEESYGSFYKLVLNAGETYQVQTDIDDQLKNGYELKYTASEDAEGFQVSSSGLVTADSDITKTQVGSFTVRLYQKGSSKIINSHYVITTIYTADYEYAEVGINDQTLDFDSQSKTYSLSLAAGDSYQILLNTKSNVSLSKEYALKDDSYSEFMAVSEEGRITTANDIAENKVGEVIIRVRSAETSKLLATVFLRVHISASPTPTNILEVRNVATNETLNDNDVIELYQGESLTLQVKYNNSLKYNVLSTESDLVEIDHATNTIRAVSSGEASVTVNFANLSLMILIRIKANPLHHLYAPNEGNDFVIHNGALHILGQLFAVYESGKEEEISDSADLHYEISDLSSSEKTVTFSWEKENITKTVSYPVKFFVSADYEAKDTAFDFIDYGKNVNGERHYLSNQGDLRFLVIPVWFSNSGDFFAESQKEEIKEDLASKILEEKTNTNYWSLKSFYETESRGKINIEATVSDFYTKNETTTSWPDMDNATKTYDLVEEATNWYFESHSEDRRSRYDADNDGNVDGVILFYSAYYYGTKAGTQRTTAYAWANTNGARHYNTACFCALGGIYGFSKSTDTSKVLASSDLSKVNPSGFIRGSCHVIHEVGHMFGAVDLYEYATSGQQKNYPCGHFSMQDNDSGGHEPYHTNMIGWTKPDIYVSSDYEVGEKITISVDDFQSSGNNIILSRDWNEYNSLFDEYLILELYSPTGLNQFDASRPTFNLQDVGFRVWHVNSLLDNINHHTVSQNVYENGNNVLKYSTVDKDSEFDVVHLIRNDENAALDCTSGITTNDLFKENDHFSVADFSQQFVYGDRLDNEEKLGWSFDVEKIYQKDEDSYTAIVTLTRIDSTRTQFRATATMSDLSQPAGDSNEYGSAIFKDENVALNYAFHESSVYGTEMAISSDGIQLFGATAGNGGSIEISVKDKTGYTVKLEKLKFAHSPTNGRKKVTIGGQEINYDSTFQGPENPDFDSGTYDDGFVYDLSAYGEKTVSIQNAFTGTINHWSAFTISVLIVEYSLIPNN